MISGVPFRRTESRRPSPHPTVCETAATIAGERPLPDGILDDIRRSRRHPRPTQFDYLHLRYLLVHLKRAIAQTPDPVIDVLDVFCGTRPYVDLLPAASRYVGLDINVRWGVPEVVSQEFLPFDDETFDLVMCIEAFQYVPDPVLGVAEISRVLRPGGTAIIAVPHVWEYDPMTTEHRFTGPALGRLFDGWDDVTVLQDGGRAVVWATQTGHMLALLEEHLSTRFGHGEAIRMAFVPCYLMVNAIGMQLERLFRARSADDLTLPMNLSVVARRPTK